MEDYERKQFPENASDCYNLHFYEKKFFDLEVNYSKTPHNVSILNNKTLEEHKEKQKIKLMDEFVCASIACHFGRLQVTITNINNKR